MTRDAQTQIDHEELFSADAQTLAVTVTIHFFPPIGDPRTLKALRATDEGTGTAVK